MRHFEHRRRLRDEKAQGGVSKTGNGEVLPAPDPSQVSSKVVARDYGVGDTIGGRFEVEEILGSGGFSRVYRVRDVVEGVERALKLFENAAGYEAVRREIGALRRVSHPNVVRVIWADSTEQGEWYLILEYVDGELLAEYATGKKQLRDREAVDVALDVLSALVAIHPDSARLEELEAVKRNGELSEREYDELMSMSENALIHRDIKPGNIMLTRAGAKLLDFNIASRVGDPVKTVSGTPPYQPPDANLTRWDVSTDLFAVGVTLYELVCDGEHPYPQARPMPDVAPRDPRQFRKDLNPALAEFLLTACANDRDGRFKTATEMKAALRVRARGTITQGATAPVTGQFGYWPRSERPPHRNGNRKARRARTRSHARQRGREVLRVSWPPEIIVKPRPTGDHLADRPPSLVEERSVDGRQRVRILHRFVERADGSAEDPVGELDLVI